MMEKPRSIDIEQIFLTQWKGQSLPPVALLEQRVIELEGMGLEDAEEIAGVPSSLRQFAVASLQHAKPAYFVTYDDELLLHRELLESRYGVPIISVAEAILLLRDANGPPN